MILIECKTELKDSFKPLMFQYSNDIEVLEKRNFSGSDELFSIALTTISSGLLASLFNTVFKIYDSKKISIKYKGVEVISRKNQLKDISTFLERIEELKTLEGDSHETEPNSSDISTGKD